MRKKIQKILILLLVSTAVAAQTECVITGCSNEICSDVIQPQMGICQWKPEYACYQQHGICTENQNGQCEWQQTPDLIECLSKLNQELSGGRY